MMFHKRLSLFDALKAKFYRELFSHSRVWLSMVAVGIKLIMIPINGIGRALDALNVLHDL